MQPPSSGRIGSVSSSFAMATRGLRIGPSSDWFFRPVKHNPWSNARKTGGASALPSPGRDHICRGATREPHVDERKMVEPEILPPERGDPAARRGPAGGRERVRVVFGGGDFRSLRFVRPSPLGILVVG